MFSVEYGVDAKSFSNLYQKFYYSGDFMQSLKLVRPMHFVGLGLVKVDLPIGKYDPKHYIEMNVQTQNQLKTLLMATSPHPTSLGA